jgi:hypothetical protein
VLKAVTDWPGKWMNWGHYEKCSRIISLWPWFELGTSRIRIQTFHSRGIH